MKRWAGCASFVASTGGVSRVHGVAFNSDVDLIIVVTVLDGRQDGLVGVGAGVLESREVGFVFAYDFFVGGRAVGVVAVRGREWLGTPVVSNRSTP